MPAPHFPRRSAQQGLMLLEALLAMVIFALGVLGLVGMYSASIKNVTGAQFRTEAAIYTETLIAQLRVADPATRFTDYDSATSGSKFGAWKDLMIANGVPGVAKNLPTVAFSGTNKNTVAITVKWQAKNETSIHNFDSRTVLE